MNTPLTPTSSRTVARTVWFWLLLTLSLAAAAVGGWLISGQVSTMTATLLDGTATGVEVYVGQSLIVVGAAVLGAGVLGILIAVALLAAQALVPAPVSPVVEDVAIVEEPVVAEDAAIVTEPAIVAEPVIDDGTSAAEAAEDQNGSSGSTATATKINVK